MLTIYRRHRKSCKHRNKGREDRQCGCPIWVDGFLDGEEIRESLKMRDWQQAQDTIRDWEADGRMPEKVEKAEPCPPPKLYPAVVKGFTRPLVTLYAVLP